MDADLRQVIPKNIALEYKIVPHFLEERSLVLYGENENEETKRYLTVFLGKEISFVLIDKDRLEVALSKYYGSAKDQSENFSHKIDKNNFLEQLIIEAKDLAASDIHVEKFETRARVRFRVNGHLVERYNLNLDSYPELVNKVKISANLDIAEKRLPQDGRINFKKGEVDVDLRVSVLPTLYGEKVVLRILEKNSSAIHISDLGMSAEEVEIFRSIISKPNGLVLISGPTGSGKTTTLYATLKELNKEDVNIVTIEDPVEYTLLGINQVQLNEKIGLGFPQALRTFLRQDPDIVMVGEIRDVETAQMATRAALTGHLVFSTVHTNSALGIFNRLVEMGISEYLLSDTLNAGIAQRLLRTLCEKCKVKVNNPTYPPQLVGSELTHVYEPKGCVACLGTGYSSRKAIYEIIPNTPDLMNSYRDPKFDLNLYLNKFGLDTLQGNAIKLLNEGKTSLEEVLPLLL